MPFLGCSCSGGFSGAASLPVQLSMIDTEQTGQAVFTLPALHFSVQLQTAGGFWSLSAVLDKRHKVAFVYLI